MSKYVKWFIIILIFIYFFIFFDKNIFQNNTVISRPITASIIPQSNDVHSPDGSFSIVMQSKESNSGFFTYEFFIENISGGKKKLLFATSGEGGEFWITPNAWSPDNNYIYILERKNNQLNAMIFKSSGESFANGDVYIDTSPIFISRRTGYEIVDITGWDSPTLLHVVTKNHQDIGPSFWFDVPSKTFMQLYNRSL
ncbi:MAG: hypothetical protein NTZ20_01635 [Candidatus Levybacteria bacterium]|nr:hypothetical protein [Candidatus Levybacteria bacterium]